MKKTALYLCLILCIMGCNPTNKPETKNTSEPSSNIEDSFAKKDSLESGVSLAMISDNIHISELEKPAKIIMSNHTNEKITTGDHYFIEHFNGNEWIELPFFKEMAFHDIGYQLSPSESKDFNVIFFSNKYPYKTGKYRVAKYYLKEDYQHTKSQNYIYAPFTIK